MIYQISQIQDSKLMEAYERSMWELNDFFEIDWIENRPRLLLVPDRATIDAMWQKKTEDWLVGWAVRTESVYMLSDKNYEQESRHTYSDERYFATLKHELAHCFFNVVTDNSYKPVWLKEGVSIFLAKQHLMRKRPEKFSIFLDYFSQGGEGVYSESGFAVEFLINIYGKEKLLLLLKQIKSVESCEWFTTLFTSIYGFEPAYDRFESR